MTLSVAELIEIARVMRTEERIKLDMSGNSITIRARCGVEDKLLKPMTIEVENSAPIKIERLGVYKLTEFLRVWIVKD